MVFPVHGAICNVILAESGRTERFSSVCRYPDYKCGRYTTASQIRNLRAFAFGPQILPDFLPPAYRGTIH
jgi:hypothetical protein